MPGEDRWYAEFVRAYARRAVEAAAEACADAIVLKLPPPSRQSNRNAYKRALQDRFEAVLDELTRGWTDAKKM